MVKKILSVVFCALVLIFIYAPILLLVVYSFTDSMAMGLWKGFTFDLYVQLFKNSEIMGILFNTAVDNTPSHIADLMIQGNNMGVVGITKLKNSEPDNGYAPLCDEFVQMSERNIEKLKSFL